MGELEEMLYMQTDEPPAVYSPEQGALALLDPTQPKNIWY